jgi:hypothetical protein
MNLHGYDTKENLEKGLQLMRDAEKTDPDATLPRMLLEASAIGGTVPLEGLKSQFKSWMLAMEEANPDQAHFASALFNLAIMARQPQNAHFWNLAKERAELGQGFLSMNQAACNKCFFPLVEMCGASIASQWSRKGAYLIQAAIEELEFSASCGNQLAAILCDFLKERHEEALRLNMPSTIQRLSQTFNPIQKAKAVSTAFLEIEKGVNDLFPKLLNLYTNSVESFTSLRMIVPWMDEACKTLEGMRLMKLSEKRANSGDQTKATDLKVRSANIGHGKAALDLFLSLDKTSEEALFYLDIALSCRMPEALAWRGVLAEDKVGGLGGAYKYYMFAIWKGSMKAYENIKGLKLGPRRGLLMSKADFAAKVMGLAIEAEAEAEAEVKGAE